MLSASTAILEVAVVAVVPISSMVVASMVVHWMVMLECPPNLPDPVPVFPE